MSTLKQFAKPTLHWLLAGTVFFTLSTIGLIVHQELTKPEPFVPQTACNAVWLGHTWIEDEHSEEDIRALAAKLKSNGIECIYLHASPLNADGSFDTSRATYLPFFLETYKANHPTATIYAWLGILTTDYKDETIGTKVDLTDYETIVAIKKTALALTSDYAFDGIQLDVEPVESGSKDYLIPLSGLKEGLNARNKILSIAVMFAADEERQAEYLEKGERFLWSWLPDYYDTVSLFTDQLVIMHYNIGLKDADEFAERVAWQIGQLQAARQNGASVIMGLPTYHYAYSEAENLQSGLQGVTVAREAGYEIDGIALYAEWTTDEEEWTAFSTFTQK